MSTIAEASHRYRPAEITPHTAGMDEPGFSPEQMKEVIGGVFAVGTLRLEQLEKLEAIAVQRDGNYVIRHAHNGQYADFFEIANREYLKKEYPWLQDVAGNGVGFDPDALPDDTDLHSYIAAIPHDEWESFCETLDTLADYPSLDDDRASSLEMAEADRWMTEDGGPELAQALAQTATNAYEEYLIRTYAVEYVWDWARENECYPEAQGQGDVYMDMGKAAKDPDTLTWFLNVIDDDYTGWTQVRRTAYEETANDFDKLLQGMAAEDTEIAHVYAQLDDSRLWRLFVEAFPDEAHEDAPGWYFWKPGYDREGLWKPGFEVMRGHFVADWHEGFALALTYLKEADWFKQKLKRSLSLPPKDHPELALEAQQAPADTAALDDPSVLGRHGVTGLQTVPVYTEGNFSLLRLETHDTLSFYERALGMFPTDIGSWHSFFAKEDVFVCLYEGRPQALIKSVNGSLLVCLRSGLQVPGLDDHLKNPHYGAALRKGLLHYYRQSLDDNESCALTLLQLGGPVELRRAGRKGSIKIEDYLADIGMYYVGLKRYALAAKAFGRPAPTVQAAGVFLTYSLDDLTAVFQYRKGARYVFDYEYETFGWADAEHISVDDVISRLSQKAVDHIYAALCGRRVWFPDAGPDRRGEYVVLTRAYLDDYGQENVLGWLSSVSAEDKEDGVFDDIIEALKEDGARALERATQVTLRDGYIEQAIDAVEGCQPVWDGDNVTVRVSWDNIRAALTTFRDDEGYGYGSDLENLMLNRVYGKIEPKDAELAGWYDVPDTLEDDDLPAVFALTPPEPYEDPRQLPLPLPESADIDSPEAALKTFSGIPPEVEKQATAIITQYCEANGSTLQDIKFSYGYVSDRTSVLVLTFTAPHWQQWGPWMACIERLALLMKWGFPRKQLHWYAYNETGINSVQRAAGAMRMEFTLRDLDPEPAA